MTPEEIKSKDKDIHAFLEVFEDRGASSDGPLGGKRIAIKDNMLFKGHKVSAGSKMLENFTATYDATAVKKLKDAGAIIVGRTNMDEFAMGSSTENSAFGPTKNPHDTSRVPGGSSGGSAAAVAAGMCDMALGSDTGGSIRQPAALCGVVGLKPTYGRVSRHGLIALASSLDQIGPFAKTVADVRLVYNVIKGRDPMDSTTISDDTYPERKKFSKIVGVPRDFLETDAMSPEVKNNFEQSLEKLRGLGYKVVDIKLPNMKYALPAYYIILPAEASSNLARYDGVKYGHYAEGKDVIEDYFKTRGEGFGREVQRRIILGTYVLSSGYYDAYYGTAVEVQKIIRDEMRRAFEEVDLVATPTTLGPAFKFGEKTSNPLAMYLEDLFTVTANIAGTPAISLPSGFVNVEGKDLPLGLHLTADLGRENNLFVAGKEFLGE